MVFSSQLYLLRKEEEPSTAVLIVLLDASFLSPIQSIMKETLRQRTQL